MPTTKPNAKKRRALSPPHTVVAKRAEVTDGTESETTTITLPIEFLKDLSTSVDTVTKGLMNMPSQVPAIRGQFVAMLSQIQTKIDGKLGIKKSRFGSVIGNDPLIDVFAFLSRYDLDALELVDARYSGIVSAKMNCVCIRQLYSVGVKRCPTRKEYIVVAKPEGAKKTELPTGVSRKCDAFPLLLRVCRNAFVENMDMYGSTAVTSTDLDAMAEHGRFIRLDTLYVGIKELAEDAPTEKLLSALQSFAALKEISFAPHKTAPRMQNCLVANAHRFGVSLEKDERGSDGCAISEEALMEYSFGACDENCPACERRFSFYRAHLDPLFLQRWIEHAETGQYRHKLNLHIRFYETQNIAGLSDYRRAGSEDTHPKFDSACGRGWTAEYMDNTGYEHFNWLNQLSLTL